MKIAAPPYRQVRDVISCQAFNSSLRSAFSWLLTQSFKRLRALGVRYQVTVKRIKLPRMMNNVGLEILSRVSGLKSALLRIVSVPKNAPNMDANWATAITKM